MAFSFTLYKKFYQLQYPLSTIVVCILYPIYCIQQRMRFGQDINSILYPVSIFKSTGIRKQFASLDINSILYPVSIFRSTGSRKQYGSLDINSILYPVSIFRSTGSRKQYASLDINSMGVDIARGPVTELDNKVISTNIFNS